MYIRIMSETLKQRGESLRIVRNLGVAILVLAISSPILWKIYGMLKNDEAETVAVFHENERELIQAIQDLSQLNDVPDPDEDDDEPILGTMRRINTHVRAMQASSFALQDKEGEGSFLGQSISEINRAAHELKLEQRHHEAVDGWITDLRKYRISMEE